MDIGIRRRSLQCTFSGVLPQEVKQEWSTFSASAGDERKCLSPPGSPVESLFLEYPFAVAGSMYHGIKIGLLLTMSGFCSFLDFREGWSVWGLLSHSICCNIPWIFYLFSRQSNEQTMRILEEQGNAYRGRLQVTILRVFSVAVSCIWEG